MDSNQILSLIRKRRNEYFDRTLAAGPGTTDEGTIASAQLAYEFVAEYDSLLAEIEGAD